MDIDEFYTKWGASFRRRWDHLAACKGEELDLFFDPDAVDLAKSVCAECPVRLRCLDDAIAYGDLGVRGGITERERHKIRHRQRRYSSQFLADVYE